MDPEETERGIRQGRIYRARLGATARAAHYEEVARFLRGLRGWQRTGENLEGTFWRITRGKLTMNKEGISELEPGPPRETVVKEFLAIKRRRPGESRQLFDLAIRCGVNPFEQNEFRRWVEANWGSRYSYHGDGLSFSVVLWKLLQAMEEAINCEKNHEAMPPLGRFVLKEARAYGIKAVHVVGGKNASGAVFSLESGILHVSRRTISRWFRRRRSREDED